MNLSFDKNDPSYQELLDEMRRLAAPSGHPRGVFRFKTFVEFNEFKEIFKKTGAERPQSFLSQQSIDK
jgi:hypothetical protein